MKHSGQKLKELRETLGLNTVEMGQRIGVSAQSISKYENGISQTQSHSSSVKVIDDFLKGKGRVEKFETNHCYVINNRQNSGGDMISEKNSSFDLPFVFRYEGQQGIHHFFRETRGGWTRTYTDAQLIGKNIQEVK